MTQTERRIFLIKELLGEQNRYAGLEIPSDKYEQERLLRSLFNIRMPKPVSDSFLRVQDAYLRKEIEEKGITDFSELKAVQKDIFLWRGDITLLKCDAVVNAANSQLLGCFYPCHSCIDNAIHTYAGVQLRSSCAELMKRQGHEEKTGGAKLTPAFNLPCKYVLHTVGPIVGGRLTEENISELSSCYRSCLELAEQNHIGSIAFCCISTGEFHFPNREAAQTAVKTVKKYKAEIRSEMKVIFDVFKDKDYEIYRELLGADKNP